MSDSGLSVGGEWVGDSLFLSLPLTPFRSPLLEDKVKWRGLQSSEVCHGQVSRQFKHL